MSVRPHLPEATERRRRELAGKIAATERQIVEMRAAIEAEAAEVATLSEQEDAREAELGTDRAAMALAGEHADE